MPAQTQPDRATAAYEAEALAFRYGGVSGTDQNGWALHGVAFEVRAGEVLGVIGPNGSGKTSLLKLLARVLRPRAGRLRLFGEGLETMPQETVARTVALVPQESHQAFPFSIAETVLMGRFPHHRGADGVLAFGWDSPTDLRLAEQAMRETDVLHLAHRSIGDVSGGERQRAIIARALTQEPRVLLLDEPTAFLDLNHQLEIGLILRRLNQERGLTVVLVSHDLNLAGELCDRLLLLNGGEIIRIGSPQEVIRPELLHAVYGCEVLVDCHPRSGRPRVTLPGLMKT